MQNSSNLDLWHFDCTSDSSVKCKAAYWMWRCVPFVLFLVGVCGNIINLIILSRPRIRKYSTTIYLIFLAVSDIVFLLTACLNDTIYSIYGIEYADFSKVYCRIYNWLRYSTGAFSVWLLVLITIERVILIKKPIFARSKLSPRLSLVFTLVLLLTISGGNSYLIYGVLYNSAKRTCELKNKRFMADTWNIIVLVFYAIVPSIVIVLGNCNIAFVLVSKRKLSCSRKPVSVNINGTEQEHETDFNQDNVDCDTGNDTKTRLRPRFMFKKTKERIISTILVLILSILFLTTTLPFCIFATIRDKQVDENTGNNVDTWRLLTVIMYNLLWSNFACNFFLYFACGSLFRQELKRILRIRKKTCITCI